MIAYSEDSALKYIRIIWSDPAEADATDITMLATIAANKKKDGTENIYRGINPQGNIEGAPVIEGTINMTTGLYVTDLDPLGITLTEDYPGGLKRAICSTFGTLYIIYDPARIYINFEDDAVRDVCVANWSSDGLGFSMSDAAAVTTLNGRFQGNTTITSFDELKYFTGQSYANGTNVAQNSTFRAFKGCTALKSASLPDHDFVNVANNYVMAEMFNDCTALERLYWGYKRLVIGYPNTGSFTNCTNLRRIDIPNLNSWITNNFINASSAGRHPFQASGGGHLYVDDQEITSVTIPEGMTSINHGVFAYCRWITSVKLPSTMTTLNSNAFWYCTRLTSITGLENITTFNAGCCGGLSSINLESFANTKPATFRGSSIFYSTPIKNLTLTGSFTDNYAFQGTPGRTSDPGTLHIIGDMLKLLNDSNNNLAFKEIIVEGNMSQNGFSNYVRKISVTGDYTWAGNNSWSIMK